MNKERLKVLELFAGVKVKVSNTGDVFSLDHLDKKRDGRTDNRKGRKLKTALRKGYPAITISHNGARKTYAVHRLVATAFCRTRSANKPLTTRTASRQITVWKI